MIQKYVLNNVKIALLFTFIFLFGCNSNKNKNKIDIELLESGAEKYWTADYKGAIEDYEKAKDVTSIDYEAGKLNYRPLYKELTSIQSRLSNRSYDMRVTDEDRNMEEIDLTHLAGLED